jgi:hypothetical protein
VRAALATLPWVEQDTIQLDIPKREVSFGLKDKDRFDANAVKQALSETGLGGAEVRAGPT